MILIVDDNEIIREMQVAILKAANYEVMDAADGLKAVEAIKQNRPDLILMDITMPGLSGYQVLDFVREQFGAELPVILVSALPEAEERDMAISKGASDYISKPFDIPSIMNCIQRYLPNTATA